jgi:hypothetical protein
MNHARAGVDQRDRAFDLTLPVQDMSAGRLKTRDQSALNGRIALRPDMFAQLRKSRAVSTGSAPSA